MSRWPGLLTLRHLNLRFPLAAMDFGLFQTLRHVVKLTDGLTHKFCPSSCGFRRSRTLIPKGTRTAFRAEGEKFRSVATLASRLCRKCSSSSRETYPERSAGRRHKRRKGCGERGGSPFPSPALERPRRALARRLRGAALFTHRVAPHLDAMGVVNQPIQNAV